MSPVATIKVGDHIPPDISIKSVTADGVDETTTSHLFQGAKVVLFGVPGAFTPTCHETHFPGFLIWIDELQAQGVDSVACLSVNDHFVMQAWSKTFNNGAHGIVMLADGSATLTERLGLELDLRAFGMGRRSRRFAMIVDDGLVTYLGVETGPEVGVSSAESVLAALRADSSSES